MEPFIYPSLQLFSMFRDATQYSTYLVNIRSMNATCIKNLEMEYENYAVYAGVNFVSLDV